MPGVPISPARRPPAPAGSPVVVGAPDASLGAEPEPADPAPRRRRLSQEDRRQELIDAALRLFSARGPEAVSVDDIAAEAGASRALLYHYFDNKHDLYLAALRAAADALLAKLADAVAESTGGRGLGAGEDADDTEDRPLQVLDTGLAAYLNYVEEQEIGFSALLREGPGASGEVGAIVERVREAVLQLLLAGVGVPHPPAALRVALRGWVGFVEAACAEWLDNREVDRETLEGILIGALSAAVAAAWLDPEEHSRLMLGTDDG